MIWLTQHRSATRGFPTPESSSPSTARLRHTTGSDSSRVYRGGSADPKTYSLVSNLKKAAGRASRTASSWRPSASKRAISRTVGPSGVSGSIPDHLQLMLDGSGVEALLLFWRPGTPFLAMCNCFLPILELP